MRDIQIGGDLFVAVGGRGSYPECAPGILVEKRATLRIFPPPILSRFEPPVEKRGKANSFALRVTNRADVPRRLEVIVEWQIPERFYRWVFDFVFVRSPGADGWHMVRGAWDFPIGRFSLAFEPGETLLRLSPPYELDDLERHLARLKALHQSGLHFLTAGKSGEGRDISRIMLSGGAADAMDVLITAQVHPGETSGSYALEGMLDYLLSNDGTAQTFRERYTVHVIPIANPDGVANGFGRLTAVGGVNLNLVYTAPDPTHEVLRGVIEKLRPALYVDLHSFLEHERDDARSTHGSFLDMLAPRLPDEGDIGKRWHLIKYDASKIAREDLQWAQFVGFHQGGVGLLLELGWYRQTTAAMRILGAQVIREVFRTHLEWTSSTGQR